MTKINISSLFSSAALALALVGNASATTITIGGTAISGQGLVSSVAGAITQNFNNGLLPSNFTANGTNPSNPVVSGSINALYAAPTGDTSAYLTTGMGSITETLTAGSTYVGLYWGSLDAYNTLTLSESNGTIVSLTGTSLAAKYSLNNSGTTSYFVNVFPDAGTTFTSANFASTTNSFEFDNVATATASPEPGTTSLLAGGMMLVAGALRRRKA